MDIDALSAARRKKVAILSFCYESHRTGARLMFSRGEVPADRIVGSIKGLV